MEKFKIIFGINSVQVKKYCILMPCLYKGVANDLGVEDFNRGRLYASANSKNKDFTLIHTGIGAGFTGDAVLYLKKTPCENMFLFGSCGLVAEKYGLSVGSLVTPLKSYSYENFSSLLLCDVNEGRAFYPNKFFFKALFKKTKIKQITCATLASLKLEEERLSWLKQKKIEVVDMECSAFFSAAEYSNLKAAGLFYISDIIKEIPFYKDLGVDSMASVSNAARNAAYFIRGFIKRHNNNDPLPKRL